MSAYRLGRFSEAIEWAQKTAESTNIYANAQACALLAMAQWQLGQKDPARHSLSKGNSLTPNVVRSHGIVDLGDPWVAWLEARISLDEAERLIQPDPVIEAKQSRQ
jgi:tetratricopeptide (TPR) repeat protein